LLLTARVSGNASVTRNRPLGSGGGCPEFLVVLLAFLRKSRNEIAARLVRAKVPGSGMMHIQIEGIPERSGVRFGSDAQGFWNGGLNSAAVALPAKAAANELKAPVQASTLNHAVPEEFAGALSKTGTT